MKSKPEFPDNLLDASRYFEHPDACVDFVASMRWPQGVTCPHCQGKRVSYLSSRRIWKCMAKDCHKQFSVKTFSIFEDSPIPLDKWLMAIWLTVNCKNGISSYEIARSLKLTQKSAWFVLHRVRLALAGGSFDKVKLGGGNDPVEVDETFIGGKPKNDLKERMRLKGIHDPKPVVMGMYDRESRMVRAKVIPNVRRDVLQNEILDNIVRGSKLHTDGHQGYRGMETDYVHATVNHINEYVRGEVHTQGIENFWSLLKRSLNGTYVAVEPFHLDRYVGEQVFRFNNRATKDNPLTDADRFVLAVSQISGKRLTYAELTGKVGETTGEPF